MDEKIAERDWKMLEDPATGKIPENIRSLELDFLHNMANYNPAKLRGAAVWQNVGPWNVGGRTRALTIDKTNENIILAGSVSGGIWRSTNLGQSWTRVTDPLAPQGVVSITQDTRTGKENIWYALSGELTGTSASGGSAFFLGDGALKSIDSGKSWQPIASTSGGLPNSFTTAFQGGWRVVSSPKTDSDYVFMAIYGAVVKSNNGGTTWTFCLGNTNNNSYYSDIAISPTGILYATLSSDGASKGFYRSANNGISWDTISPTQYLTTYNRTVLGINPNNENEVLFFSVLPDSANVGGTSTSNYEGTNEYISLLKYTYISGNGTGAGSTWQDLSANLPNNANISSGPFDKLNTQGGYDMYVKYQPTTNAIFIAGTNIYRSDDSFATANNTYQIGGYKNGTTMPYFEIWPNHHPDNHDLVFLPSDYKSIISASDGGIRFCKDANIATTSNPAVWSILNNGYLTTQLYTVTLDPVAANPWMVAGFQDNGNFMTTNTNNPQSSWTDPFNGDGAYNYIAPNHAFLIMSIQQGRLAKFNLDANGNVLAYKRIDPIGPNKNDYGFVNPFVVDPNNNDILYFPAGKSLYRQNAISSIVLNNTWDSISQGWYKFADTITAANFGTGNANAAEITAVAVSKYPANTVYIGTSNRLIYRIDSANGANPKFVNITKSPLPTNSGIYLSSIAVDPTDSRKVLICYSNYKVNSLFYTIDSGFTWKFCGGNLEKATNPTTADPSIRWVDIMQNPDGGMKYFCGTSIGLFSTDTLRTGTSLAKDSTVWTQEDPTGIGAAVVTYVTHRESDNKVAVATHGNGAYLSQYFFPTDVSNVVSNNSNCSVYPNPANSYTTLIVASASNQMMQVSVFDLLGRRVINLGNIALTIGENKQVISTQNLSNGTYLIVCTNTQGKKFAQKLSIQH